jgi:hypothetical protein
LNGRIRPAQPYSRSVILAAGLLVLLGLGLFVAGILTGATALYWGCVAACVVAAVLLVLARRQMTGAPARPAAAPAAEPATAGSATSRPAATEVAPSAGTPTDTTTTAAPVDPPTGAQAGGATAVSAVPADGVPASGGPSDGAAAVGELDDPPVEEVEVTDLLLVVDVKDEVLVIDERPRYHLAGCVHLAGRTPIPLPLDEAKSDGFTPCAVCEPDRNLAQRVRARR